ncbi:Protein WHAT'S THIS FACTOR 9, mitochondrial [Linum grandiflorum]
MKWKKDPYFDSIEHIHKSKELKRIHSLKNVIARNPNGCIPISDISKYLRQYPSIFEEFVGPQHNLPWKIIKGLGWYLGFSDDMLQNLDDGCFRLVDLEGGLKGLAVESEERGVYSGEPMEALEFPLFPSKGLRLKKKIADWLNYSYLDTDSDIAEKRVVGFLHELLCLFVEHSAERKKLLCLKKYFGLPQKVHKAFERHPHLFYLSHRNKTRTAILKEAYRDGSAIERHPLVSVRQKYVELMMESDGILKTRRRRGASNQVEAVDHGKSESDPDCNSESEEVGIEYSLEEVVGNDS